MTKIEKLKEQINKIFKTIDRGMYLGNIFRAERAVGDMSIHKHMLSYLSYDYEIYPDYSYTHVNFKMKHGLRIEIETYTDNILNNNSFIFCGDNGSVMYRFNPHTMDTLEIRLQAKNKETVVIPLKDLLTEEAFFMYSTLYVMPEYEMIRELLVMGHQFRGHLLERKVEIFGSIPDEVLDIHIEALNLEMCI